MNTSVMGTSDVLQVLKIARAVTISHETYDFLLIIYSTKLPHPKLLFPWQLLY